MQEIFSLGILSKFLSFKCYFKTNLVLKQTLSKNPEEYQIEPNLIKYILHIITLLILAIDGNPCLVIVIFLAQLKIINLS